MLAPIDAAVTVPVEDGTIELRLNFRTLALAATKGVDLLRGDVAIDAYKMVALVSAFATPAHPEMDEDRVFAMMLVHGKALGEAIGTLLKEFAAAAPKAGGANPPRPREGSRATS